MLEQDGNSQAKLLLHRFVARAAELKIPVCRSSNNLATPMASSIFILVFNAEL